MTIEEVRSHIKDRFGVDFQNHPRFEGCIFYPCTFRGKKGEIQLDMSKYWTDDERNGKEFIGYDIGTQSEGQGGSLDSFEELDEFLSRYIKPKAEQLSLL